MKLEDFSIPELEALADDLDDAMPGDNQVKGRAYPESDDLQPLFDELTKLQERVVGILATKYTRSI